MDNNNDQIIDKQLKSLPLPLQKAIAAVPWKTVVREIGATHSLNLLQIDILTRETMFILYGFEDPQSYPENLRRELIITQEKADKIADEVAERVLLVVGKKAEEFEKSPTAPIPPKQMVGAFAPKPPNPPAPPAPPKPPVPPQSPPPPPKPFIPPVTPPDPPKPPMPPAPPPLPQTQAPVQPIERPVVVPPPPRTPEKPTSAYTPPPQVRPTPETLMTRDKKEITTPENFLPQLNKASVDDKNYPIKLDPYREKF